MVATVNCSVAAAENLATNSFGYLFCPKHHGTHMKVFRQLLRPLLAGRLWQRQLTVREVPNMLEYLQEVLLLLTNSRPAFNHDDAHFGSFCFVMSLVPCDDSSYQDCVFLFSNCKNHASNFR
mmetsp:Transcript_67459/g.130359  ORF Transcript_67459/g.130359 Transcript_67459/m.130359 type:complete len:122 (+) Transcript_67459:174-539(+)